MGWVVGIERVGRLDSHFTNEVTAAQPGFFAVRCRCQSQVRTSKIEPGSVVPTNNRIGDRVARVIVGRVQRHHHGIRRIVLVDRLRSQRHPHRLVVIEVRQRNRHIRHNRIRAVSGLHPNLAGVIRPSTRRSLKIIRSRQPQIRSVNIEQRIVCVVDSITNNQRPRQRAALRVRPRQRHHHGIRRIVLRNTLRTTRRNRRRLIDVGNGNGNELLVCGTIAASRISRTNIDEVRVGPSQSSSSTNV